jgi:hypothetical protein
MQEVVMSPAIVQRIRFAAVALSGVVAVLYLLIGISAIAVVDGQTGLVPPILIASGLFAALAVMAVARPSRPLWITGGLLQVLVMLGYFAISAERTPAFEAWGIGVKVLQVLLLAAFLTLLLHRPRREQPPVSAEAVGTRTPSEV